MPILAISLFNAVCDARGRSNDPSRVMREQAGFHGFLNDSDDTLLKLAVA